MRHSVIARFASSLLLASLLAGCAGGPAIPDTTYYRLGSLPVVQAWEAPLSAQPLVVPTFVADGVHSDQALLYALDDEGMRLRAYHYQLWVDPPTRMLQRRLIATLRRAGISPLVVDNLPRAREPAQVSGRIIALERVPAGDGWTVQVALGLRYEPSRATEAGVSSDDDDGMVRVYRESRTVANGSVADSARLMGDAIDTIFERFLADLQAAQASQSP
ncbi:MAG: hypothetical protein R3F22_09950 [Lysobacteraceae bacterium]